MFAPRCGCGDHNQDDIYLVRVRVSSRPVVGALLATDVEIYSLAGPLFIGWVLCIV